MMEHFYRDIPGYFDGTFVDIYHEAVERAANGQKSSFVEVGSWKGRSTVFMAVEILNSGKQIDLWCVDTWDGGKDSPLLKDPELPIVYEIFCNNVAQFPFIHPVRMRSLKAATSFVDGTLDFVMIDASHEWEDTRDDILAWLPKLKLNGVLAGDDYNWPTVWRGVNAAIGYRAVQRRGRCWVRK